MAGDNPKNDVSGAQAFGLQARRINRGEGREAGEIGSLREILDLVS